MAARNNSFNLTINVNGKKVKNHLNAVGKELRSLRGYTRNLEEGTEEWYKANKELAKTEKIYDDMKKNQRKLLNETKKNIAASEDQNEVLNDFAGNVGEAFSALRAGDLVAFRAAMFGVAGGIKAATGAALAWLATPMGASIAALGTIAYATKKWFDYNVAVSKTIKLTEQLTDFSGKRLSDYRASVQATADTFDKDFNEVLRSANSLSKQMGITQEEALELINQGFTRGADAQGDFLDKVKEYPVQFKNAGYSAQEFIDIATQEATGGVYGDKLIDAIKEADLSLKEFTETQREAVENAFGKKFADELAAGLSSGQTTTEEALSSIMQKSDELGLNLQQKQQLVADVFKGAGEDAGGFEEILQQINEAFDEENKKLNENERATQRLIQSNTEYEKALADLFDTSQSGFPAMLTNLESISNEIMTGVLVGLKRMFTSIEQLKEQAGLEGQSDAVKRISENIKKNGTTATEEANIQIRNTEKNISRLRKRVEESEGMFSGWFGKESSLKEQLAEQEAYLKELKNIAKGESEEFQKYLEEIKTGSGNVNSKNGNGTGGKSEDDKKAEEERKKKEEKELERIREFEARKQELLNELELQKAETDQEKEELKEEQNLEKQEEELEQLQLNKAEKDELMELLEQNHQERLLDIRAKFNQKNKEENQKFYDELIAAEQNLQQAKNNALGSGLNTLRGFFSESSGIYKALFLLEKGLAANEVVTSAAKGIATAKANLAAVPVVIPGTVVPNPMYPVAAATAAKNILSTKLTAAAQLATIAGSTLQGFSDGGFTDMFGMGYRDQSGHEVAGVVHKNEYVVPEIVRRDPEVPQILNYLETKRKRKLGQYADGGDTVSSTSSGASSKTYTVSNDMTKVESLLNKILMAQYETKDILFGPEAEIKRQEQEEKIRKIQQNAKVKK